MTISPQMRIAIAAVAVLAIVGFAAKTLLLKSTPTTISVPPPVHHSAHQTVAAKGGTGHRTIPHLQLSPNLPPALRLALLKHDVVVAVVYAKNSLGDGPAVSAARTGARGAHVGFAVLNVANEAVATAVALTIPGSSDPSVAVVKRPGQVMTLLPGYIDSEVITQAARDAGR
jgi:hypothetical protein